MKTTYNVVRANAASCLSLSDKQFLQGEATLALNPTHSPCFWLVFRKMNSNCAAFELKKELDTKNNEVLAQSAEITALKSQLQTLQQQLEALKFEKARQDSMPIRGTTFIRIPYPSPSRSN